VKRILDRLDDLAPVAPVVMTYLRPFLIRAYVVQGLAKYIPDDRRASSPYMLTWVLALALDHPGPVPLVWVTAARKLTHDRNRPAYLRAIAANVMSRGQDATDIAWLRKEVLREFDPSLLRGYAVALFRANALDKNSIKTIVGRVPELGALMRYLAGRQTLPSLLFRDRSNDVGR
jgi:hypothetical protein